MTLKLTTKDHSRDAVGLKYVYPVLSRRAGGVSIGINFNTNNACNWRCIYCQVPNLVLGSAPELDLKLLQRELSGFLEDVLEGDFFERYQVAAENRIIKDIAISGNGEPTSLKGFAEAVSLIGETAAQTKVLQPIKLVLITNGSLVHQQKVRLGLDRLNRYNGQVWFKIDSATEEGVGKINHAAISLQDHVANLISAAKICPTWLQTCIFPIRGQGFPEQEKQAYLKLLKSINEQVKLQGVLLYTIARPSLQPEAAQIAKLSEQELNRFATDIRALGVNVKVSC